MERAPLGFCLSFEPRRERQRRTSGRGQATSTGPELRFRSSSNLQTTRSLICVRPRVADPSGLPLARAARMERAAASAFPRASHPADQEPTTHVEVGTGHRARTWNYTLNITSADPPIGSSLIACDIASHRQTRNSVRRLRDDVAADQAGALVSRERAIHLAQVAQCSASVTRGIGKVVGDHGLRLAPRHTTARAVSQGGRPPPLASCMAPRHRRVRHLIQMDSPFPRQQGACASSLVFRHLREDADAMGRPELPWISPPAGKPDHERAHLLGAEGRADGRPAPAGGHGRLGARSYRAVCKPEVAEITGAGREWSVAMISELSIPWR